MNDAPSEIDPLVGEGPRTPVETLRPGVSLQRVLLLDEPGPMMADLATGDIRRYESGPPVSVPMVSDGFDLGRVRRIQVQVIRDPRPSSISQTLFSLDVRSADCAIDVRITPSNVLELVSSGAPENSTLSTGAGESPALVILAEQADGRLSVSVRNAEVLDFTTMRIELADLTDAVLTVGGPSTRRGDGFGRRRSIPVLIDIDHHGEPIDQLRRAVRVARRVAGLLRNKAG